MLNLPLELVRESEELSAPIEFNGVIGTVGFTGKMTGLLYLCMSERLANEAAARILGGPASPEDVNDVIGELTNMVTGNLKSKMVDQGYNSVLSIPTVLRGEKIAVASLQAALTLMIELAVPSVSEKLNLYVFARLEE